MGYLEGFGMKYTPNHIQANNLAAEIDQEQIEIHKFGKDVYTKRFPELETLVVMVSIHSFFTLKGKLDTIMEHNLMLACLMAVYIIFR